MSRFSRAKQALVDALDEVVPELFPGRRRKMRPGAWHVTSPGSNSKSADQMVIWRQGLRRGGWADFVAGEKGDAIDLIAYVMFGQVSKETRMRAVSWAEDRFGLSSMDAATRAQMERTQAARREKLEAEDKARRADNRERTRKMFFAADEKIMGTPVELYFQSRGVVLADVQHFIGQNFRFQARCTLWTAPGRPEFPALVSKMVDGDGRGRALHLTYIEPDGSGKLDMARRGLVDAEGDPLKAKLMWPDVAGLVIRVTDGASGLSAEAAAEAGQRGIVAVTEGIEDALSVAYANPELRVWAAGSLPNLFLMPDHPVANGWLIFRDNDWNKPQAVALFSRAIARLKSFGKPVHEISMPAAWGKDVNDALNG